jgi:type IV secretion system coupling TraD/TrwB family protein
MSSRRAVASGGDPDPLLAFGRGLPDVPWTIGQRDRIYNVLIAGGQGSGKSSLLLRIALADILAANTATVVLDMKGTLSERLLRLTPPDVPKRWWDDETGGWQQGEKRVWYLDLGRPAFGLTPLRVEPGWQHAGLADEFARIADAITRALLDLFPGQIMGSSEDLIERAVVGTMAIAWWEHEQRCDRDGQDPTARGFSGSFEVLAQMFAPSDRFDDEEAANRGRRRVRPNRWHQAAGRACQRLPNLDQVADTLLYEIPRQARDNLADIAKRMEAPANKIRPLVGAAASVRRFVGHPERLSLRSVIEAHDILIVNPRIELIGEDQASILTNFVVHMLDLELKRLLVVPRSRRPRVSLIIDEAHRLVTDTLITMTATHREARLTVAAAVQYVSQLGADAPTEAHREKILKGVGNLLQIKVLFRMSDSDDAHRHSQIFRPVYETMVRADPTSRARMPFDPARMQTLRDHHALVSLVCSQDSSHSEA